MLIKVGDGRLDLLLNACFFGLAVLSLVPWRLRDGSNRWSLYLPLPAAALYLVYEWAMPSRFDIRLDLFLILPLVLVIVLAWVWRLRARPRG